MKFTSRLIHFVLVVVIITQSSYAGGSWVGKVFKPKPINPCDIAFVKELNGKLPAELLENPKVNLWDPRFDANSFVEQGLKNLKTKQEKIKALQDLKKLVSKDQDYINSLSDIASELLRNRSLTRREIDKVLLHNNDSVAGFYFSPATKKYYGKVEIDLDKIHVVDAFLRNQKLSEGLKREYRNIFLYSNRNADEIEFAIENGLKLRDNKKGMIRFKEYMEFTETMNERQIKKAFKNVDEIYNYKYSHNPLTYGTSFLRNSKQRFLIQKSRVKSYQKKRLARLEKEFKKQNNGKDLTKSQKARVAKQAAGEGRIFSRLLNGCNGKGGKSLKSAAKKFKRFKFALSLVGVPAFYFIKNKDKLDKNSEKYDQYFYERLGYEMGISLLFTSVSNKIFTNTNPNFWERNLGGFWGKYFDGFIKFGSIDIVNAYGYDALFGKTGYASYVQKIYRDDIGDTPLVQEYKKLKNSPTFKKDVEELYGFLEERSKDANLKNWLNDKFNLYTYKSGSDPNRITQEDLETVEGKEMLMELLAEKMYADNMGQWEEFQSGNHGVDRWLFYRVRNSVWDMKGLLMNLAIFQIMCREPLGKVGSWGLIIGMVVANELLSGDFTYEKRREAINQ